MIRLQEYFFFCSRLIRSIYNGEVYPQVLFLSDEAWLSLCGEVKSQSSGCWSTENPGIVHELPSSLRKILCLVSGQELRRVNNVLRRYSDFIRSGGQHFQHLL